MPGLPRWVRVLAANGRAKSTDSNNSRPRNHELRVQPKSSVQITTSPRETRSKRKGKSAHGQKCVYSIHDFLRYHDDSSCTQHIVYRIRYICFHMFSKRTHSDVFQKGLSPSMPSAGATSESDRSRIVGLHTKPPGFQGIQDQHHLEEPGCFVSQTIHGTNIQVLSGLLGLIHLSYPIIDE